MIILHLDQWPALLACLEACRKLDYDNHELIVVENGLAASRWREATASPRDVRVVTSAANVGYAAGNNLGIRDASRRGADYVLLLNDDALVVPELLRELVEVGERTADVGSLGPLVVDVDDSTKVWFAGAAFDPAQGDVRSFEACAASAAGALIESDYVTGCCLLIKRSALERVGLLDARFFLYWEDTDWGLRARMAGLRNVVVPGIKVRHRVAASSGGIGSPLRVYHRSRSHLVFLRRHAPGALPRLHRRFARDVAWLALKSEGPGRLGAARAILAALRDYHLGRTGAGPAWIWRAR
ncbi:MAG TPA: glycosyltransferase family 2 protein [Methylomirabilota bacterium]|nr:glycosyltransferase family 2 protein [Methylomirabilota bacterium]